MVHPWCDNCYDTTFRRFFAVFVSPHDSDIEPCLMFQRFMLPVYSALHLIPMLVLRRHHVQRDPLRMLARAILGITRSCSFLGVFVMIYQALFCLRSNSISKLGDASWLKRLLMRKETFWAVGFSCCASLFVEEKVCPLASATHTRAHGWTEAPRRVGHVRAAAGARVGMVFSEEARLGAAGSVRRDNSRRRRHGYGDGRLQGEPGC